MPTWVRGALIALAVLIVAGIVITLLPILVKLFIVAFLVVLGMFALFAIIDLMRS